MLEYIVLLLRVLLIGCAILMICFLPYFIKENNKINKE